MKGKVTMKKVITYGTYDLLHYGHIKLLERAKALGDYLIVGVTSEDFDKARGKINVKQSLIERMEAVKATGLADEIIIEEYEGQKIDDIKRYGVDVFTVGTDWLGYFDYLREYCEVVYLERTEGVSSTEVRAENNLLRVGFIGNNGLIPKYVNECQYVNGLKVAGAYSEDNSIVSQMKNKNIDIYETIGELLDCCDAIYISSHPSMHYEHSKLALERGVHVLCESPISIRVDEYQELSKLAEAKGLILMDSIKTAYAMAYNRLLLMLKAGKIGDILSVDATCTSLHDLEQQEVIDYKKTWNSMCAWGMTALLPVFQILGTNYKTKTIVSMLDNEEEKFDTFTKIDFIFDKAVASVKAGKGVKSEGELIVSGTKGYAYVPAPWWKTDYFEIRYEDIEKNQRYFYQLDGEGIRYEFVAFANAITKGKKYMNIEEEETVAMIGVLQDFYEGKVYPINV